MKKNTILLIILLSLVGCKDDMVLPEREYYILVTNEPQVDAKGITLTATFAEQGEETIKERGFYLKRQFLFDHRTIVEDQYQVDGEEFKVHLTSDFDPESECWVRAYMKTDTRSYLGEEIYFKALGSEPPVIHSISPTNVKENTIVTITGENFSKYWNRTKVYVNGIKADLESVSPEEIKFSVPYGVHYEGHYDVVVTVAGQSVESTEALYVPGPILRSLTPESPLPGEIVTLTADNIDGLSEPFLFFISDYLTDRPTLIEKTTNTIKFVWPNTVGEIDLRVSNSQSIKVTTNYPWEEYGTYTEQKYFTSSSFRNIGYLYDGSTIQKLDFSTNKTETIKTPNNSTYFPLTSFFFATEENLYLSQPPIRPYEPDGLKIYKYNLTSRQWSTCQTKLPLDEMYTVGNTVVIDNVAYGSYRFKVDWDWELRHFRYFFEEDRWEEEPVASTQFYLQSIIVRKNQPYRINDRYIEKIDFQNLNSLETIFTAPESLTTPAATDDNLYVSMIDYEVFRYHFATNEFIPMGMPAYLHPFFTDKIDFIFAYAENVYVGVLGKIYKYRPSQ